METQNKNNSTISSRDNIHEEIAVKVDEQLQNFTKDFHRGLRLISKYSNSVTVFGSARFGEDHPEYIKARELGGLLAKFGHPVITGGSKGIMEAANRGAYENGGESIGLNIHLPHEQSENGYTTDSMSFRYFAPRKVMLAYSSSVFAVFPGGFGTLDELFEIITLVQTGKMPPVSIVLIGSDFWKPLDSYIRYYLEKEMKTISPGDTNLYYITDDLEEVIVIANQARERSITEVFLADEEQIGATPSA
jgi:uncharacterized protein (TIGR00730 family)